MVAACDDTFLQEAVAGKSWQTAAGLWVGATLSELKRMCPTARHGGDRWALLPYGSKIGE
jgi:hypothetical protein